jgi:hypothetical protein
MVESPQALLPYLAQPLRDLRAHSVNPSLETS